jgi:hypothetical protein
VTVPNSVLAEVKKCKRSWTLEIVRGATHLFEEPGSRACRRIGQGLLSQVPGARWRGARARPRGASAGDVPLRCAAGRRCRAPFASLRMARFKLGVLEIPPVGADADFH